MIEARPDAASFGKRGVARRPEIGLAETVRPTDGADPSAPVRGPLPWALGIAALVGFGAVLATQLVVRQGAPGADPVSRLAEGRRVVGPDPETTGAIGPAVDPAPVAGRCGPLIACLRAPPGRPHP